MSYTVTLKENRDFKRLYRQSKSFVCPALVVYFKENRAGFSRLGITAGKKIGCAVKRNRAKRLIREAYRGVCGDIEKNYDFVIVARSRCVYLKSYQVQEALRKILCEAGVIKAK